MKEIYDRIVTKYGYNEPIFTKDLKEDFQMNPNTFRQVIKRLSDNGYLTKVGKGIYFIPRKNALLKHPKLSVDKIVSKKYLYDNGEIIGYKTGINFANALGLTTQTASIPTIVTNNTSSAKREVTFYNKRVIIKQPKATVNAQNYKLFQVIELVNDFERVSEEPIDAAMLKIRDYLKEIPLNKQKIQSYLNVYSPEVKVKFYEAGIMDEFT
ncbi:DUF6088 family protein [Alkalicoccus daliensis]|uniref:Transcriptional regulator, AbiEi antitoxin, Type IV TA system n=1 Tax=Alkalicoccus daliensis TaxID=745820 RepID=A0A1H0D2W0_9BACI|nr:DUF6088 family protein [Alkalicoccus daliensis]SDN64438.1 hypothetical protein SAMN04488053_102322 [Alkalicoccus daliensis]